MTAVAVCILLWWVYRDIARTMDQRDAPSPTSDVKAVEVALMMYHEDTGRFPPTLDDLLDAAAAGMAGGYMPDRRGRETIRKVGYQRTGDDSVRLAAPGALRLLEWKGGSFVGTWLTEPHQQVKGPSEKCP